VGIAERAVLRATRFAARNHPRPAQAGPGWCRNGMRRLDAWASPTSGLIGSGRRAGTGPAPTDHYFQSFSCPSAREMEKIFRLESERAISDDWVVRYENRFFQLEPQSRNYAPARGAAVGVPALRCALSAPLRAGTPKRQKPEQRKKTRTKTKRDTSNEVKQGTFLRSFDTLAHLSLTHPASAVSIEIRPRAGSGHRFQGIKISQRDI
jgi:hypothetical protein